MSRILAAATVALCAIPLHGFAQPVDLAPSATETQPAEAPDLSGLARLQALLATEIATLSRVDERVDLAPGSAYVYSRAVIQQRGYRSLGELLQTVPGFVVFHRDLQFVAGVRGLSANDNEKLTLLINGQNLNGVSEPEFLNGPINLDNVERVEVVVGPSSLFQPANTLAATVNVITKDVQGGQVSAGIGNDLNYSTTLMAGVRKAPDRYLNLSFTTEQKNGFHAWRSRPNLGTRTGRLEGPSYFGLLKGQLREWTSQVVAYQSVWPELNIDEGDPANKAESVDRFYSLFVKNDHPWSESLTSVVRLDATYKKKTRLNPDRLPINGLELSVAQMAYTAELGVRYTGMDRHLLQAGVQGEYDHNFDTYTTVNFPPSVVIPKTTLVDSDSQAVGFYADDQVKVTRWLRLVAGARVDHNTVLRSDRWYPGARAAILLEPTANWVTKLTYNRAARMPTSVESPLNRAWGSSRSDPPVFARLSTNANRPEVLSTFEWQNIVYLWNVRLAATLYHQDLQDFISWLEPWTNIGDFSGNGVELGLHAPIHRRVSVLANGSWNDSTLKPFHPGPTGPNTILPVTPQGRIVGAPKYTANLGLELEILQDLMLSPAMRYFTDQAAFDDDPKVNGFTTIRNRAYFDATLIWRNWTHVRGVQMDARLSGYNLTNNRDAVAGQWRRTLYQPRGVTGVFSFEARF